ncbi:MAG: sugar phosphate isomerase/epimerase family protein, partial [Patescibacteria group bacterium]
LTKSLLPTSVLHLELETSNLKFESISGKAREREIGVEFQSFYEVENLDHPEKLITVHRSALDGVAHRSMHGPFGDLCPGSFDPLVREVSAKRMKQAFKIAKELKAESIVLHGGYVPNTSSPEGYVSRSILYWKELLQATPVSLHIENHLDNTPDILMKIIDGVGDPRLGVCLDIGHAHAFSDFTPPEWVAQLGERITYVHLHDNHGKRDEHLRLGAGSLPVTDTLRALEKFAPEAIWAIEADEEGSYEWLQEHQFIG